MILYCLTIFSCVEGICSLNRDAKMNQLIQCVMISRGSPQITHLLFDDDSLLSAKPI